MNIIAIYLSGFSIKAFMFRILIYKIMNDSIAFITGDIRQKKVECKCLFTTKCNLPCRMVTIWNNSFVIMGLSNDKNWTATVAKFWSVWSASSNSLKSEKENYIMMYG